MGVAGSGRCRWTAGPSSEELAQIKVLKKENADLREANEILKAASIFFARGLDPRHR